MLKKVAILAVVASSLAFAKPNVVVLATGGTIAGSGVSSTQYEGYQAAVTGVEKLLAAVPELKNIASVSGEQVAQVASQDMSTDVWLKLAKRVNHLLQQENVDGVVITHGTNTMEETAYFLNLVVKSKKPVVMVGAMRPGTAMSADGPMNIYNGVLAAGSKDSIGKGVMVVLNDRIISARDIQKTDTITVDTFKAPIFGYLGQVVDGKVVFFKNPINKHTYESEFDVTNITKLPKVDINYGYANDSGVVIDALVANGTKGIVHAGAGTASMSEFVLPSVEKATKKGIAIVRTPRTSLGMIGHNMEVDDDKYGTIAGGTLSTPKARVLLMLGLTKSNDPKYLQELFFKY